MISMDKEAKPKQAGPRGRAAKADGESAALKKIAAMPGAYRAMGVRLHAIIISECAGAGAAGLVRDAGVCAGREGGVLLSRGAERAIHDAGL